MGGGRSLSIDLVGFVALLLMIAHSMLAASWPPQEDWLRAVVNGPPLTLFAVFLGAASVLAVRGRLAEGARGSAALATLVRGLLVTGIGLALVPLTWLSQHLLLPMGLALAVSSLLLLVPAWVIALAALALAAGGGWTLATIWPTLPHPESTSSYEALLGDPLAALSFATITGPMPALTLLTYVLTGALVARLLLAARDASAQRRVLGAVLLVGALLTAAGVIAGEVGLQLLEGPGQPVSDALRDEMLEHQFGAPVLPELPFLLIAAPASGSWGDIARTAGMALGLIGVLGLVCSWLPLRARQALEVPRATGAAPLSMYVLHAVLSTVLLEAVPDEALDWVLGTRGWALHAVVLVLAGLGLALARYRGPLEAIIDRVVDLIARHRDPVTPEVTALPDDTSLVFRMRLRAPIEAVWAAIADPQQLLRWSQDPLAPIVRSTMDVRPGGSYRWDIARPLWGRAALVGDYRRVEPPHVLVQTIGPPGHPPQLISADWLQHHDGITTLETSNRYASAEQRDVELALLRHSSLSARLAEASGARPRLP